MANVIKYKTSNPTKRGLRKGNTVIGIGEEGYGPTSTTGYVNGITPPDGGYVVYTLNGTDPVIYVAKEEIDLVAIANTLGGSVEYPLEAKQYLEGLANAWVISSIPKNVITDGLVVNLDAKNKSSFLNYYPTTNLLEQSGASTLATRSDIYNNVTKIDYGNGKYRFINDGTGSTTIRLYCNLNDLTNGETYACSISYENFNPGDGTSVTLDWCDVGNASFSVNTYGTKNRISMSASRATYDNTYRFFDISISANADITLYGAQVELGTEATSYKSGNGTRAQNTTWKDISGGSHNVSLNNGPTFNPAGYISFDGVNDYAPFTSEYSFDSGNGTDYTFEVLFKMRTLPTAQYGANGHIWGGENGNDVVMYLNPASGGVSRGIMVHDDSRYDTGHMTTGGFEADTWAHWVAVGDGTNNTITHYINGQLDRENGPVLSSQYVRNWGGTRFAYDSRWGTYSTLDLSVARQYTKKLSAEEVSANYYGGPITTNDLIFAMDAGNLVSYESGSVKSYSLLSDTSGSLENGVAYHPEFGGYFSFDGSNDRILMEQNSSPSSTYGIPLYQGDKPWMVNAWVRTTTGGSNSISVAPILSNRSGGPVYCNMGIGDNGVMKYNHYDGAWQTSLGTIPVNDGRWHMLSWVNRDNDTMDLYVDGVFDINVNSEIVGGPSNPVDIIGGSWASYFDGDIAFLALYRGNNLFTHDDVMQNYNALKSRFPGSLGKVETDGDYLKVFRQYSGNGDFFSDANGWAEAKSTNVGNPDANKYSILDQVENYRIGEKYTFKLVYPTLGITNIWSQTNNPVTDDGSGGVTGYSAISIGASSNGWGGLERYDTQTSAFLDGTLNPIGNWYYAIGSKAWSGATTFPGPSSPVNEVELWIKYK
jgi:hypothetical protein